jgi:hypothetical protein
VTCTSRCIARDDGDKGGNTRHVIFDGRPDNLHWIWDTGLLEHINRTPVALELESRITEYTRWYAEAIVNGAGERWRA